MRFRRRDPLPVRRYALGEASQSHSGVQLGFHPWNHDNSALARDYIETMALTEAA